MRRNMRTNQDPKVTFLNFIILITIITKNATNAFTSKLVALNHSSLTILHPKGASTAILRARSNEERDLNLDSPSLDGISGLKKRFQNAADEGFGTRARNVLSTMSVGDTVVPICGNLALRQTLANKGCYAGVEYKICSLQLRDGTIISSMNDVESSEEQEGVTARIKPAYNLRDYLERSDWPVEIVLSEVPLWLSKTTYEAGTMLGTLSLASFYVTIAAILAFFVRFAYVPSPSMQPTLNPGDVVIVTRSIWPLKPSIGDVILFDPPSSLNKAIMSSTFTDENGASPALPTKGQQFLKRVVAREGELVGVKNSNVIVDLTPTASIAESTPKKQYRVDIVGPYSQPEAFSASSWDRPVEPLGRNQYFVAGDNGFRSVDSRVWGSLPGKNIFGVARWVVWPLSDFGPCNDKGQISYIEK